MLAALIALVLGAPAVPTAPAALSLADAIELGIAQNRALEIARLDVATAASKIDAAWSSVYPRVDLNARYTRNLAVPNPFSGASAGGIFGQLNAVGWLAHNEQARSLGRPGDVLTLQEYAQRQAAGMSAAGVNAPASNPFLVENSFSASIGVTQNLYNGAAFAAIRGASAFLEQRKTTVEVEARQVLSDVAKSYYGVQLATARIGVIEKSISRIEQTLAEVKLGVAQGVLPQFQQLTVEVELANVRTQRVQAQAVVAANLDGLRLTVGLPASKALMLTTPLELAQRLPPISAAEAFEKAKARRPDLKRLRLSQRVVSTQAELQRAGYLPIVSAFANVGLVGNVPDERQTVTGDPTDPFRFTTGEEGFFADAYWDKRVNVGLSLSWNLFSGFRTGAELQQTRIEQRKLGVSEQQLLAAVEIEVERALRDLATADQRMRSQSRNVARATTSYDHARARTREGVSSPLELRNAGQQLDQTRFNHLQAVHDYLVAWTAYAVAIGAPAGEIPGAARLDSSSGAPR